MKKIVRFFRRIKEEFSFIRSQWRKIIWPEPSEAGKIFAWTFSVLLLFGVAITFVFDPLSVALVSWLSGLSA